MFISTRISSIQLTTPLHRSSGWLPVFAVNVSNSTTYHYPCPWSEFDARSLLLRALSDHIKKHELFEDFTVHTECWNNNGDTIFWEVGNVLEEV